jgi:hypothetical protein
VCKRLLDAALDKQLVDSGSALSRFRFSHQSRVKNVSTGQNVLSHCGQTPAVLMAIQFKLRIQYQPQIWIVTDDRDF